MLFWLCVFLANFLKRFHRVSFQLTITPFPEGFFWKADEVTLLSHHEAWDFFKCASAAHVVPNLGYMQFCYSIWRQFWQDETWVFIILWVLFDLRNYKYCCFNVFFWDLSTFRSCSSMHLADLLDFWENCCFLRLARVCCCQHKHLNTLFMRSNTVGLASVLSCKYCPHKHIHEQH